MSNAAWDAMSDPTRRDIVRQLAAGDLTAGEIARRFAIARPGVSRHLRVLREAGLVESHADAQRRVYRLLPGALEPLDAWFRDVTGFWEQRLDALDTELRRGRKSRLDDENPGRAT